MEAVKKGAPIDSIFDVMQQQQLSGGAHDSIGHRHLSEHAKDHLMKIDKNSHRDDAL